MATLSNPLSGIAQYAIKTSNNALAIKGKQLATGNKGTDDIVDYIVGSSLKTTSTVLSGVSKGVSYGSNMCTVGQNALQSVKSVLMDLRNIVAQAGTATGSTLTELQNLYIKQMQNIYRVISTTEFDGRLLFNGSLADVSTVSAASQKNMMMPVDPVTGRVSSSVLQIRTGEAVTGNSMTLSIPRILSGTGLQADIAGTGAVGGVTAAQAAENATKASDALRSIAALVVVGNLATSNAAHGALNGLAAPGNAVGDSIVTAMKAALPTSANAMIWSGGGGDNKGAASLILNNAMMGALNAAAPYLDSGVIQTLKNIINQTAPAAAVGGAPAGTIGHMLAAATGAELYGRLMPANIVVPGSATSQAIYSAIAPISAAMVGAASFDIAAGLPALYNAALGAALINKPVTVPSLASNATQGIFEPLLPITQQAVNDSVSAAGMLFNLWNSGKAAGAAGNWTGAVATNPAAVAAIIQGNANGFKTDLSALNLNKYAGLTAINAIRTNILSAMSGTASVGAATTQGAMQTLSAVTTNALVASRNYIHSEAYDALIQLNTVLGGMGVDGKSTDCYTAVQAMKLPGTTLGDAIIKAAQGVADTGGAAGTWIDQASLIFQAALEQGNIGANQFNSVYGLTEDNIHGFSQQQQLKSADEVINSALDKVNQLISALGGDREVLDQADDDIGSFRVVLEDTANSYLDTNYEEAAAGFKELLLLIQGALAEITQGFQVPQSMLQLINA